MNKETLRMQMLSGIITEGEYKAKLNEQTDTDFIKSEMERHIGTVNNDQSIPDQEKKRRIDNIRFVVYDFLDPNTNGGKRPSSDFQFDDNWWDNIPSDIDKFVVDDAATDLVRAAKGDSFGENDVPLNEKDSLNEGMIGGIVGIGAINQIPPRAKTDYETAFEHFLGARYELNENEGSGGTTVGTLLGMLNSINPNAEISLNYDGKMGTEVKALNYVDTEMANDEDQPEIILVGENEEGHMTVGELKSELSKLNPSTYVTLNLDLDSGTVVVDNIEIDSEMASDDEQPEIILFGS